MSKAAKQAGFTILELMIATMVFSVILLMVTYGVIQIGNRYYKSVLQSQTQAAARNAVDEIARGIQFSSGNVYSTTPGIYCINGIEYAATLHQMQGSGGINHTLVVRNDPGDCSVPNNYFKNPTNGSDRDLLGNHMRVINFSVDPAIDPVTKQTKPGVFKITLRVASGDDELLCSPSKNDCADTTTSKNLDQPDLTCKAQNGSAYCAVSELSTYVTSRLAP